MKNLEKQWRSFICIMAVILAFSGSVFAAESSVPAICLNGVPWRSLSGEGLPFTDEDGYTQIPVTYLKEWGYEVQLFDDVLSAYIYKTDESGRAVQKATVPVRIQSGTLYVPIRETLTALGDKILWNQDKNQIYIGSGAGAEEIQIHFIDVGEGDCTLIDIGETEILIDAGPNQAGQKVVDYLRDYVDGSIELVIATHVHHDHIGGMDDVLKNYEVKKIIHCGDTYNTKSYLDYYAAVQAQPECEYVKDEDMTIELEGGAELKILNIMDGNENLNNNSVVAQLNYGTVKVLFTADIEQGAELSGLGKFEQISVLKVAHHGSSTSSTTQFLAVVKPEIGIISAGYANDPKHPHLRALKRLAAAHIKLYGTFLSGSIVLSTDGTSYWLNTDREVTLLDAGIYHAKPEQAAPEGDLGGREQRIKTKAAATVL